MLSPSNARTQTLECIEGGVILRSVHDQVEQLYVQNPAFGFYFLRPASARLFQNIETLEQRLARQTAAPVAASRGRREHRGRCNGRRRPAFFVPLSVRRFSRRGG
jgi:hypothetical protein